ncbi:MAG TPA: hypothetical protein VJT73_09365 [Polyangiaceae bacterium]|nr:hypothetical protein [Polyangiaceae bacterium]
MVEPSEWSLFDPGNVGAYLGRVEKVRPGQKNVTILDARQTDDRQAGIVTVLLSVAPGGMPVEVSPLRAPTAHIEWGVAGGRDSVDVDFLHGQALSITATFIRIVESFPLASEILFGGGELGPDFGVTDPDDDAQVLLLGASLGSMPHPQAAFGATPRLTTLTAIGDDGATPFVPIPNHAQSVTVLSRPEVGNVEVGAYTAPLAGAELYCVDLTPGADVAAVPLARGVEFVRVAPVSGRSTSATLTLLWTIGL